MPEPFINVEGLADTLAGAGTLTTPAAAAQLASVATPVNPASGTPPLIYEIEVTVVMSGTRETQPLNLRLFIGGTALATLLTNTADGVPTTYRFRETLNANSTLALFVTALATTGAIYTASLRATRLQ